MEYIKTEDNIKLVKKKASTSYFDRFWEAFPSTDTFTYNDVKFEGSRALKMDKEKCKLQFNNILNEGDYSAQDIIDAVKYDVLQKKKNSYKTKQNKLQYIQNSLTYLRQRSFEPYIELAKEQTKEIEEPDIYGGVNV